MKVRVQFTVDLDEMDLCAIAYRLSWGSDPRKNPPDREDVRSWAKDQFEGELFWARHDLNAEIEAWEQEGIDGWTGEEL